MRRAAGGGWLTPFASATSLRSSVAPSASESISHSNRDQANKTCFTSFSTAYTPIPLASSRSRKKMPPKRVADPLELAFENSPREVKKRRSTRGLKSPYDEYPAAVAARLIKADFEIEYNTAKISKYQKLLARVEQIDTDSAADAAAVFQGKIDTYQESLNEFLTAKQSYIDSAPKKKKGVKDVFDDALLFASSDEEGRDPRKKGEAVVEDDEEEKEAAVADAMAEASGEENETPVVTKPITKGKPGARAATGARG